MANENVFLLYALLMGIFITFVYDLLRIVRRVIPHGNFCISLEDILFWIYCAAKVFLLMYHESDGTLRWFAILGAMVGMLLYKKLVSPYFVKYTALLFKVLLKVLGRIWSFLTLPVRKAGRRAVKSAGCVLVRSKRSRSLFKKKLTVFLKLLKMNM